MSSFISFLKCLTIMDLSLAMKDVSRNSAQYTRWFAEAEVFLKKHRVLRPLTTVSNKFKKTWEFTEDLGDELGAVLKTAMPQFVADTSITHEQLALLKDLALFMRKDSAPAWTRIGKNVSLLHDNTLAAMFLDEDSHTVADMSVSQSMCRIVQSLTQRKNDPILSVNEMRDYKETNPKLIEKYSALRKEFKENFQKSLLKFVRTSGKQLVDVERARSYLNAMGCNYLPTGFVGMVDEKGKLYTSAGKALRGTMFGKMAMNPAYDPKTDNTFYAKLLGDMRGELRTADFLSRNKSNRMAAVEKFTDDLEKHRKKWLSDLSSLEKDTQVQAAIIECIHLTHARIGGEKNKNEGKQTYGISTLRVRHVRFTSKGMEMKYPGKKGTMQHHTIRADSLTNRKVINIFKSCIGTKGKEDRIFTVNGRPVLPSEVNRYLKSLGVAVTIHKFRHVAATKVARDLLAKAPFNKSNLPTQAQAERWLKTEAVKIGTMLHHRTGSGDTQKVTGTTAIAAYISPDVLKKWFTNLGLRAPKWLPAFDE